MNNQQTQTANNADEYVNISATCAALSPAGICLSNNDLTECWFPRKLVVTTLEPIKGKPLNARIPAWLYEKKLAEIKTNARVKYKDLIRIEGYCVHITDPAFIVYCNIDRQERPFAKSKVHNVEVGGEKHQLISLIVPSWMVKRANGDLPAWVSEVLV